MFEPVHITFDGRVGFAICHRQHYWSWLARNIRHERKLHAVSIDLVNPQRRTVQSVCPVRLPLGRSHVHMDTLNALIEAAPPGSRRRAILQGHWCDGRPLDMRPEIRAQYILKWRGEPIQKDLFASCIHRGEPTGVEHACELCGDRGKMEPVYECALHGVCTIRRWTLLASKQPERTCIRCEDLTLADGSQPLKQPSPSLD